MYLFGDFPPSLFYNPQFLILAPWRHFPNKPPACQPSSQAESLNSNELQSFYHLKKINLNLLAVTCSQKHSSVIQVH